MRWRITLVSIPLPRILFDNIPVLGYCRGEGPSPQYRLPGPRVKPIRWMRSSREDLKAFPDDARGALGHNLHLVQLGERPNNERRLHGDLSGVSELTADSREGTTYRSVFTVKLVL